MVDPGFPRGGVNLLFGIFYADSYMKMKKLDGGTRSPRSVTVIIVMCPERKTFVLCKHMVVAASANA